MSLFVNVHTPKFMRILTKVGARTNVRDIRQLLNPAQWISLLDFL